MKETIIATHKLSKDFGPLKAVHNLNLNIEKGKIFAFLGANGAGKSTTIRMLLGLIKPSMGEVKLFGKDQNRSLLSRIGAMVEGPSLYPHLTGRENLELTAKLRGLPADAIRTALNWTKMEGHSHRPVKEYSLGMKQRLALSQALLGEPELLILDEPTNGLDPSGIQEIRELLKELVKQQGLSLFLSSHILSEVEQMAKNLAIIHRGQIQFQGSLTELRSRAENYLILKAEPTEKALEDCREAGWPVERLDQKSLKLRGPDEKDAQDLARFLVNRGYKLMELHHHHPSLEDIYLQLTEGGNI